LLILRRGEAGWSDFDGAGGSDLSVAVVIRPAEASPLAATRTLLGLHLDT
jgi:hypothetical protein